MNVKPIFRIVVTVVMTLTLFQEQARAQLVTYDPANHAEQVIQSLRQYLQLLNEAKMISNQLKNLSKLDFSIEDELTDEMNDLFGVVGEIDGIMRDFRNVEEAYLELAPEWHSAGYIPQIEEMIQQTDSWLDETNRVLRGAAKTGSYVLSSMPQSQSRVNNLIADSQGAEGALQAAQAGNQISGEIATQLMKMNTMLSEYVQVVVTEKAQRNAAQSRAQAITKESYVKRKPGKPKQFEFNILRER